LEREYTDISGIRRLGVSINKRFIGRIGEFRGEDNKLIEIAELKQVE